MISFVEGNLFESPAQVLVNTVNTVGAMGKGVAKEFKHIYPEMFKKYQELCESGSLEVGKLFLYKTDNKWVLNFPTKIHWNNPSKTEYIEDGLKKFVAEYSRLRIHSIAFPPLGAGNGELDFETEIRPLMIKYLHDIPIQVFIYPHKEDDSLPEHKTPLEIKNWLRSEPESLSFDEVWEDLLRLLLKEPNISFKALKSGRDFRASINSIKREISIIRPEGDIISISYELLFEFWKQLRSHGFSVDEIAPVVIINVLEYIIPIFSRFKYAKLIEYKEFIKDDPDKALTIGLQYLPPIKTISRQVSFLADFG